MGEDQVKGCLSAAVLFAGAVFFLFGALGAVTSMSLPWACLGGGLMCLGWRGLCSLAQTRTTAPAPPAVDRTKLHYCKDCGCPHRLSWMRWVDEDTFRCRVCCEDGPVFVDRNVH
jgi:hypothetical protein